MCSHFYIASYIPGYSLVSYLRSYMLYLFILLFIIYSDVFWGVRGMSPPVCLKLQESWARSRICCKTFFFCFFVTVGENGQNAPSPSQWKVSRHLFDDIKKQWFSTFLVEGTPRMYSSGSRNPCSHICTGELLYTVIYTVNVVFL